MTWLNRMSSSLNAFWNAYTGANTGRDTQLVPLEELGWDDYPERLRRYAIYEAYRTNTVYSNLFRLAAARKANSNMYRYSRSIYNPVARQNDLLQAYIYGGSIDTEDLSGGNLPIVQAGGVDVIEPLKQLIKWSRLQELNPLRVSTGATLGDAPLKLVDDPKRGKVWIEQLDPRKVNDMTVDAVGNVKGIVIEYEREEEADLADFQPGKRHPLETMARTYTYTEVITKEPNSSSVRFRYYKDGEPFDYVNNVPGGEYADYISDLPFVPVVWGGHKPTALGFYANAFGLATPKIDEVNDAASLLNDQIRKTVNVIWAYTGVGPGQTVNFETTARDQVPYVTLPVGGDAKPLVAPLQLAEALANIQSMLLELERDMPELALQRVREQSSSLSAPGVRAAYSDAIGRIELARSSYNASLVRALQMGVTIGGMRGYDGFAGFNADSYDDGRLDFHVGDRSVISDELSKSDKIMALGNVNTMTAPLQKLALEAMGYSTEDVDSVTGGAEGATVSAEAANQTPDPNQQLSTGLLQPRGA